MWNDAEKFPPSLLDDLTTLVSRAAAAIVAIGAGALDPRSKSDHSPVTAADEASEAVILKGLAQVLPGVPVVSEEAIGRAGPAIASDHVVLVDPLDGTSELLAGRDEFTVNVAIVCAGVPVLGIVAAPALGLVWRTARDGGAERLRLAPGVPASAASEHAQIRTRPLPTTSVVALVSRSHPDAQTDSFLARWPDVRRIACGSSIKLCRVAEGQADIYPRLAPTRQWDVAAGQAVLEAAGGIVTTPAGDRLTYKAVADGYRVPGFIAWGDPRRELRGR